jgi:hypothetical protein
MSSFLTFGPALGSGLVFVSAMLLRVKPHHRRDAS